VTGVYFYDRKSWDRKIPEAIASRELEITDVQSGLYDVDN